MVNLLPRTWLPVLIFLTASALPLWAQTSAVAAPRYPLSHAELQLSISEIDRLVSQGAWLEAKDRYKTLLQHDLLAEDRGLVELALGGLNMKILFSPILTPDSFNYVVKSGDSLYKIAKAHKTTVGLLKKSNGLEGDLIRPDMKLKVSKAVYSILVDKSENELILYADGEVIKRYIVATGRGDRTPIGTFTIENKLVDPVWYRVGAILPPDSPDNILGTRWMGFSLAGYGIHGTTLPDTIGTHATKGCIRMFNHEVEELYIIIPHQTQVTVVE